MLLLPAVLGGYWMRVLTMVFIFAIMAESVNIIAGYTGYNALGNAVFFGTGAYIVGVTTTELDVPFWAALLLAGLGCALYCGGHRLSHPQVERPVLPHGHAWAARDHP